MKAILILLSVLITMSTSAQNKPYYYKIPAAPSVYTPTTVAARLVDGLGFRYFWATEGLREQDLSFRPSDSARTSFETLEHIYGLTQVLLNAVNKRTTPVPSPDVKYSYSELREKTLYNIKAASDILKSSGSSLEDFDMVFERKDGKTEYPFWNLINGPISDALWHVGQVVTFRRSSGNPLPKGVNVLRGEKFD
ncbi:MAG TPA: hypothetical protein PKC72_09245 [Chitinophagaceae bacterium]|nr:hypothetical protein [Chitinophagaceae bacterium]